MAIAQLPQVFVPRMSLPVLQLRQADVPAPLHLAQGESHVTQTGFELPSAPAYFPSGQVWTQEVPER